MDDTARSIIYLLPWDVLDCIFQFLHPGQLLVTKFVCKYWRKVACNILRKSSVEELFALESEQQARFFASIAETGCIKLLRWYKQQLHIPFPDRGLTVCIGASKGTHMSAPLLLQEI